MEQVTETKPSQPTQPPTKARFPFVLTVLALLLPCLGLVTLHIFSDRPSMLLPLILANSFLIITFILCWMAIRKRGMSGSFSIIVAAIIGICIFLFWPKHVVNNVKYSYPGATTKLSTTQTSGMTFSKPSQFTSTAKKTGQDYSTESFAHLSPSGYPLGYIFTFSYKDSHTNDKHYISGINDFMNGSVKNKYSSQYIDAIKKQVFDSYPDYKAKLGEPQKFTNANIKSNAWSFDLDVTSYNQQVEPMKGKLIYALDNGTIHYFSLMVAEENWTPNMSIWQTVLDSLKF